MTAAEAGRRTCSSCRSSSWPTRRSTSRPPGSSEVAEEVDGEFVTGLAAEARKEENPRRRSGILEKSGEEGQGAQHGGHDRAGREGASPPTGSSSSSTRSATRSRAGSSLPPRLEGVFKTRLAKMGMMTCYELRFPEMARILALQGAELIVVPTAWLAGRMKEEHLHVLAKARALENTVFVAVASQTGRIFTGRSLVVDPFGVSVCDAGEEEGLTMAEIDTDRVSRVRKIATEPRAHQKGRLLGLLAGKG